MKNENPEDTFLLGFFNYFMPANVEKIQMTYQSLKEIDHIYNQQVANKDAIKQTTSKKRIALLQKLLDKIISEEKNIERALYQDFHKSAIESAITEILAVQMELKHIIKHLAKWMENKRVTWSIIFPNTDAYLHYEPKGNVLIITPWNYPFQLPLIHLAACIAAGNTAILKLSEYSIHSNQVIRNILKEVFTPDHVAVIEGEIKETTHLLEKRFDHIHFTGSSPVGKIIMTAAAKHLSDITLELGGKSPAIVDKNVNVRQVVRNLIWAKFVNAGQTCIAPDYLYVHKHLKVEFEGTMKRELMEAFGTNAQHSPDYARIINEKQFNRLTLALENAKSLGANIISGGTYEPKDLFIQPTVITQVAESNTLLQDEIFGPILPVIYYSQINEALEQIAKREKPLSLYVFSRDNLFNKHVIRYSTAGSTCINDALIQFMHPALPFGGVNNSGLGQSTGKYGFKAFSHERAVANVRIKPISSMFWFPYTERTLKMLQWVRRLL